MKRYGRPRRWTPKRKRRPFRGGALIIGLVAVLFLLADRGGLDDLFTDGGAGDVAQPSSPGARAEVDFTGDVTRVVDGDTFWISGQEERIRVWGLDAPEVGSAAGSAATAFMTRLIEGQTLQCRQRDIDRYGRVVGQCWLPDGRDIAAAMINSGTATEYCRFSRNHYSTC